MKFIQNIFLAIFLLINSNVAFSETQSDANKLFNWLEGIVPELLSPTNTQYVQDWCLRHYQDDDLNKTIYIGVVCGNGSGLPEGSIYVVIGSEVFELGMIGQYAPQFKNQSDSDGSATSSAGHGNCVNIPFAAHAGITETLLTTTKTPQGEHKLTTINNYISVNNTTTVTKVSLSDSSGFLDSNTTITESYQIKDDYLWPSANDSEISSDSFGVPTTTKTSVKINPPYPASPVNRFCEGQSWTTGGYSEITSETMSVLGNTTHLGTSQIKFPGYTGTVNSVNESVSVPAGTFNTVQMQHIMPNGDKLTTWVSTDIGALVKMKVAATANGQTVDATTELLKLQR